TKNKGKYSWKVPTKDKGKAFYAGDDLKIKVMAIGRAGKTINDLSDKVFSIVKASGGGSKGGGSTGGGSTGGGSTGGGSTGGNNSDPCVGKGASECNNPGIGGGGADNEPGNPVVPTISLQTPKNGDAVPHGQNVRFSFTVKDGAGYDFCVAWCVEGQGPGATNCDDTTDAVGPFSGSASGALTFSQVTADYDAFLAVAYGFPTGAGTCISVLRAGGVDGLITGGGIINGSVTAPAVHPGATYCWDNTHAQGAGAGNGWVKGANACGEGMTGCYSNVMSYVSHWAPQDSALWLADCAIDPINCTQCRGGRASCCTGD
ncbi:hypothetical protein N9444_08315, partial [Gammaproteobacteria bacterium]|nr:hypothetical protein [Gammaproteobacteria bacterium]